MWCTTNIHLLQTPWDWFGIYNQRRSNRVHTQSKESWLKLDFLRHSTLGVPTLEWLDQLNFWQQRIFVVQTLESVDQLCLKRSLCAKFHQNRILQPRFMWYDNTQLIIDNYLTVLQIYWKFNLLFDCKELINHLLQWSTIHCWITLACLVLLSGLLRPTFSCWLGHARHFWGRFVCRRFRYAESNELCHCMFQHNRADRAFIILGTNLHGTSYDWMLPS